MPARNRPRTCRVQPAPTKIHRSSSGVRAVPSHSRTPSTSALSNGQAWPRHYRPTVHSQSPRCAPTACQCWQQPVRHGRALRQSLSRNSPCTRARRRYQFVQKTAARLSLTDARPSRRRRPARGFQFSSAATAHKARPRFRQCVVAAPCRHPSESGRLRADFRSPFRVKTANTAQAQSAASGFVRNLARNVDPIGNYDRGQVGKPRLTLSSRSFSEVACNRV